MSNGSIPIVIDRQTGFPGDTGCEVSPSCLGCPLPQCRHDDSLWYQDWIRRAKEQRRRGDKPPAYHKDRVIPVLVMASQAGVSQATMYRMLRRSDSANERVRRRVAELPR